jgi:hypothetical protein
MTTKEIYESIDQSKISPKGKDFLQKAEKSTKGFTIENEKLETVMRKIYKDLKERKPEALKNVKVKTVEVTEKVPTTKTERKKDPKKTTKTVKKEVKKASGTKKNPKPTKTPSTPKEGKKEHISTRASKLAKKEGITFKEARAKISKLVKEESKKAEKQTEKELDKLLAFVRKESFEGEEKYPKTYGKQKPDDANLSQDAKRRAKPVGKRVSKNGKTYYEYRDNRSDRNSLPAPKGQYKYKGKTPPYLKAGGEVDDIFEFTLTPKTSTKSKGKAQENSKSLIKGVDNNSKLENVIHYATAEDTKRADPSSIQSIRVRVFASKKDEDKIDTLADLYGFKVSSSRKATMKGNKFVYAEGGTLPTPFGQAGLVGETGAMNEIDLFAMGGDLPQGVHQYYANTYNPAYPTPHGYAKGGKLDLDEYYSKMIDKLGKEGAFERVLKDSQFGKYKGQTDYQHNRLNKSAIINDGKVFLYDNKPKGDGSLKYSNKKTFTSPKDLAEYLDENEIFAKGGFLSFKSTKEADKYIQSLSEKEFKKLGDFALVYNGKEYQIRKDIKPVDYAKGGEIDAFIMSYVKGVPEENTNLKVDTQSFTAKLKKGGKLGFDGLAKKVAKRYEGKPVKKQFQNEYGKTYSKAEAMEVGRKVAGKVYRQQQSMEKGGELSMESYWDMMIKTNLDRIKRIDKIRNQPIKKLKEDKFNKNKSTKEIVDNLNELKKLRAVYKADNNKLISNFGGVKKYSEYLRKEKNENTLPFAKGGEVIEYSKVYEILKDKIDEAVEDIYSTYEQAETSKGEEVESKSRDGFIPFTNGGYSSRWFEYSNMLEGSGIGLPTKSLDDKIEEFRERNREYGFERFEEEYPEIVKELGGIENVNYSALEDAGYSNEADDLDMFIQDDDDSVMMEVEAFYYTPNNDRGKNGKHTIQLSGVVNLEAPYHRSGNLEDYIVERFTFDSYKELEDKLDKGLAKVVSWFEGDMYDKNPRELKIRKMEAGGTLPTPFGQAGLVGETGTMNEMDLFAMGGDLPQGVHQYYANTYNPAYPTPHGYAKGGDLDSRYSYDIEYVDSEGDEYNEGFDSLEDAKKEIKYLKENGYRITRKFRYLDDKYVGSFAKGGEVSDLKMKLDKLDPKGNTSVGYDQDSKEYYWEDYKNDIYRDGYKSEKDAYNNLIGYLKSYAKGGEVADVNKFKKQLIAKAKRKGLYENFGQAEVRKLEDKYGYSNNVREFDNWAMNFDLSQMAKGGKIGVGSFVNYKAPNMDKSVKVKIKHILVDDKSRKRSFVTNRGVISEEYTTYAKGGKTQGYNDKLDESLGNTKGKRSTKEQNYKDRRNESEAMEKKGGKRKYARVKTMDKGTRKKRKTPMTLAKAIRRDGEKWQDAVKRATIMMKKEK